MRRDIDPIKIIQILPFSNRPEKPPDGPSPLMELLKKTLRAARDGCARLLTTIRAHLTRVRLASFSAYEKLAYRVQSQKRVKSPIRESPPQLDVTPVNTASTRSPAPVPAPVSVSKPRHPIPAAVSIWLLSARESVRAAWPVHRARLRVRLDGLRGKLAVGALTWREKIRKTWGTQESWRTKTEQVVRPLTSAVRSLRRRHQGLVDQLKSTHAIVQCQQQEITELAFQLASIKTEMAAHTKTIDELTHQVKSLQIQVAQIFPSTHGTTGQSGPPAHGRRGTSATKRNSPGETGPQSKAEH
jgi:hypothetical protein